MAQTAQALVESLVDRATKLGDPVLAADIRAFAAQRQFGLVFEHNRPERMRLYGKPVRPGDVVQVLPERGRREDDASRLLWRVESAEGGLLTWPPIALPPMTRTTPSPVRPGSATSSLSPSTTSPSTQDCARPGGSSAGATGPITSS